MDIEKEIFKVIYFYQDKEQGINIEDDDGNEMSLLDDIVNIFNNHNISEYNCDYEIAFENCGCTIYTVSTAWVENEKLKTVLNAIIEGP